MKHKPAKHLALTSESPGSWPLAGLRLLVVEDNVINQQVARELLERSGAQVAIAGGGLAGVAQALAARPPFDAILMDLQMPDVDGFEATRRIHSQARLRTTPIIAMTANAMSSDKADCKAAGMCDHVGKPVDLEQLIAAILRHVGVQKAVAEAMDAPGTVPDAHAVAVIDSDTAIERLGGSREFYQTLVSVFLLDAVAQSNGLVQCVAQADYATALHNAHTLKGSAATVGANPLAAAAAECETLLKRLVGVAAAEADETLDRLRQSLPRLQTEMARALETLTKIGLVA